MKYKPPHRYYYKGKLYRKFCHRAQAYLLDFEKKMKTLETEFAMFTVVVIAMIAVFVVAT